MKLVSLFNDFLKDTVNLNKSRIDLLEDSVKAIKDFVRQSEWEPKIRSFEEQGSWAHETIIKPVDGAEFDADLLVMVDPVEGWNAADYVANLGKEFSESPTYKDKTKTWDYCVTVSYVGDRKIDIAPCVKDRLWVGSLEVCNRLTNKFDRSEPTKYTDWMKQQNSYSGSNSFRKVTRLLKYIRDIKGTFTCPSVLLTTLLGNQISWIDKDSDDFADIPTTLRTVVGRLDDWLQARSSKPVIANPFLSQEDFAAGLTADQYSNFRNFINKYRKWIDEAFLADDRSESIKLWQRVFGDEFAKGKEVVAKQAADSLALVRANYLASAAHLEGLVKVVQEYGLSALPSGFYHPPYMQDPPWRQEPTLSRSVQVLATWHNGRDAEGKSIRSGETLPPRGGLWFDARVNNFELVPAGYEVQWRITNTGAIALAQQAGRGGFYVANRGSRRWESLQYRGIHIAEAFIIRMRDSVLIAQSPPFTVVIE